MGSRAVSSRRRPLWLLISAAWLGPATLAALTEYVQSRIRGAAAPWRAVAFPFGDWLLCALLTPAVFVLAARFPLGPGRFGRRLLLHASASLGFCVAWSGLGIAWGSLLNGGFWTPYGGGVVGWLFTTLPFGVAVYFSVLGVAHGISYLVQSARLTGQLAEARLAALRTQMQPHFLLNSLNAITVVARDRDTSTAVRMLEQLGELLRRVLRSGGPPGVPLAEELDFVRQYLGIEEMRFSDRLRPVFDVEPSTLGAAVPEFLLQPLVENAVRHGLAGRTEATTVRIAARREGDDLVLTVTDDGPAPDTPTVEPGEGVALANTRERLRTLYGDRTSLELTRPPQGGASAVVRLPYRELENRNA